MNVFHYKTKGGKDVIFSYLDNLPAEEKARGLAIIDSLKKDGTKALEVLDTRQLVGKLWEIKFSHHRIMYVIVDRNNMYLIHACKKQKNKTEKTELRKAIQRVKELERLIGKRLIQGGK